MVTMEYTENVLFLLCRNSSGSTPLHLAAGTGHAVVVAYLLRQRDGHAVKAALDNDGKSPLAVCLDSKSNDWKKTAEILRDAYNSTVSLS
jgi:ankyrin repeat protein